MTGFVSVLLWIFVYYTQHIIGIFPDCNFVVDFFLAYNSPPSNAPTDAPTISPTVEPTNSPTMDGFNFSSTTTTEGEEYSSVGLSSESSSAVSFLFLMRPTLINICHAINYGGIFSGFSIFYECNSDQQLVRNVWWNNTICNNNTNGAYDQWIIEYSGNSTFFKCDAMYDCPSATITLMEGLTLSPTVSPTMEPSKSPTGSPTKMNETVTSSEYDGNSVGAKNSDSSASQNCESILGPNVNSGSDNITTVYAVDICLALEDFGSLFDDDDDSTTSTTEIVENINTTFSNDTVVVNIVSDESADSFSYQSFGYFCNSSTNTYTFIFYEDRNCSDMNNSKAVFTFVNDECFLYSPYWTYVSCSVVGGTMNDNGTNVGTTMGNMNDDSTTIVVTTMESTVDNTDDSGSGNVSTTDVRVDLSSDGSNFWSVGYRMLAIFVMLW